MRSGSHIFVATLALVASACSWISAPLDPLLVTLERTLKLEIVKADRLNRAGAAEFTFKLSNHGTQVAKACLGPSRSVSYQSSGSSGSSSTLMHDAGCIKEVTLQPGGEMTWREELEIPTGSQGDIEVEVDVEILNPRTCGGWGCSGGTKLTSKPYSVR